MKPRIYFKNGVWWCGDARVESVGNTPSDAYREWTYKLWDRGFTRQVGF